MQVLTLFVPSGDRRQGASTLPRHSPFRGLVVLSRSLAEWRLDRHYAPQNGDFTAILRGENNILPQSFRPRQGSLFSARPARIWYGITIYFVATEPALSRDKGAASTLARDKGSASTLSIKQQHCPEYYIAGRPHPGGDARETPIGTDLQPTCTAGRNAAQSNGEMAQLHQ